MTKMGPPTKLSKGERTSVQFTITIPAEMNDQIGELMTFFKLGRSRTIQVLLERVLEEYSFDKEI